MQKPEPAVDVHELSRTFGSFTAVDKISLQVAKGEIFGFLGPNGAGKSTTIRMLCGLLMPTGGGGTVGGYDIRTEPEAVKNIIGYMSQKFSLYDDLTVEENINFFGGVYRVPKEKKDSRKAWVLAMAGIEDKKFRNKTLRDKWGCSVAGGQDTLEGKMFRVSHMGYVDPIDTIGLIAAVEYSLIECGVKGIEPGKGVATAVRIIKEWA